MDRSIVVVVSGPVVGSDVTGGRLPGQFSFSC